ncbi:MAG: hypothetical protein WDM87_13825 [Terracidiphilus sp.]
MTSQKRKQWPPGPGAASNFAQPSFVQPRFGRIDADLADVDSAITSARDFVFSLQHPDGYWCSELEADSMLEADYIFLHTLLESGDPGRLKTRLRGDDALPEQ